MTRKRKRILVLSIVLSGLIAFLQSPLDAGQEASFWKNPPETRILSNGLLVIAQKDESSAVTVIQILIKGGKAAEPIGKEGLSYLTTRLSLEIPDNSKVMDMMSQATRIWMGSRGDHSLISIACLSENLEDTLELVSKIMLKPLFSGIRIDNIKKLLERQREVEEDDPVSVAHNTLADTFFNSTSYAGSFYGSKDSLKAIKKKDIENFYKTHFNTGNMSIVLSSDLDPGSVFETVDRYFNRIPSGPPAENRESNLIPPDNKSQFIEKDTLQSLVSVAYPLPRMSPENIILVYLLENLLGKGINSRLWFLRSEKNLAYSVNARATVYKRAGMIEAYLETDLSKTNTALEELRSVFQELMENGIDKEELQFTKVNFKASLIRENETKNARTQSMAEMEALGLGYDFLNSIYQEIDAISLDEINAFIKEVFQQGRAVELVIGPKTEPQ